MAANQTNTFPWYTAMNSLASLAPNTARAYSSLHQPVARGAADGQQTLANRLAERLGLSANALNGQASDYSPQKVADRVLGAIEQRLRGEIAAGADSSKLQGLLSQAREGVEKGFADARQTLDGLGLLSDQVAATIDDTYQRLQDGLSALDQRYATPATGSTGNVSSAVTAYSERFVAQAQTFSMDVTTRDGDKLHIAIAQASSSYEQRSAAAVSTANGSAVQVSSRSSTIQMGAFEISVEGELDDQERASLANLFGQVQDLSNKFYAGDMNGAFDQALKLQLDGSQLASLSLHLTQTRVRQATDAYSAVAEQGGQAASAVNGSLLDYAKGLMEALSSSAELSAEPVSTLQQLLSGSFALDERFDPARLDKADALHGRLLEGLQNLLTPRVETSAAA